MEGNIWERYAEFRTRLDELDACAAHMPPDAVAERLLRAVEGFFEESERPPRTGDIAEIVEGIEDYYTSLGDTVEYGKPQPPAGDAPYGVDGDHHIGVEHYQRLAEERYDEIKALEAELDSWRNPGIPLLPSSPNHEPPVGDDHFYVVSRTPLFEVAAEIAAHREDGYDPDEVPPVEQEPATTKPGMLAEDPRVVGPPAGASDSSRSQNEEPKKPCKTCKEPKPLSDYYKDARRPDGLFAECKDCHRERQRRNEEKRKVTTLPRTERAPEPEKRPKKTKDKPEQLCGNGQECVAVDDVGHPTKLNKRNTSGICGPCEEHERNVGMSGHHSGHIVRHGAADRGQS